MQGDADVVVVGSGPAGSCAAYFLVQSGFRVLVVDKARLPRYKVCAGGVPATALQEFPFSFSPVIEQWVERMTFLREKDQVTHNVPPNTLAMVMRDRFDHYLVEQSGAEVMENTAVAGVSQDRDRVKVHFKDGSRPLQTKYVIGADGPNSRVARSVGLRRTRRMGVALEAEVQVDPAVHESFQRRVLVKLGDVENGYAWVFPKSSHLSVGIGSMTKGTPALRKRFEDGMARLGVDLGSTPFKGHPLPVFIGSEQVHTGRVLLAGDAAGLVDPLTGEGIRHAIESGRIAAEAVASGRIDGYSRRIEAQIGRNMCWGGRLARLLYGWPRPSYHWLIRHKLVFRDMIRVANDRLSYKQAIMRLPLYAMLAFERVRLEY